MLAKLLKYEFKAIGRLLLPLFGALMVISILLGVSLNTAIEEWPFIKLILGFMYSALFLTVALTTFFFIIQRFYKNLLGNEGYIMFTLPISVRQHILNKLIAGSVWTFFATIVGMISIFIVLSLENGIGGISIYTSLIWREVGIDSIFITILVILNIILAIVSGILKIYAAITIGHQLNNRKVLGSIGAYILLSIGESIIFKTFTYILDAFSITDWFFLSGITSLYDVLWGLMIVSLIKSALLYIITYVLMKNKLNLE